MAENKETRLQRLRELVDDADARAAYAVTLLQPKLGLEVIRAALRVLVQHPYAPARVALTRLFDYYAAQGVSRDPGTYVRSEIIRALRPIIELSDLPLLEQALTTYEFPPPAFQEECALLRSGALVTMAEVDDIRARFHATRLLADPLTDPMSGEPALTAVSVLVAQGELLPLYYYATQDQARMRAEVGSSCLRSLAEMPSEALPALVAGYAECKNPVLLVGLVDLLMAHPNVPVSQETLARLMVEVDDMDLYRYLVTVLLASGKDDLRQMVLDAAQGILPRPRQLVMREVLTEAGEAEDVRVALAALSRRMAKGR